MTRPFIPGDPRTPDHPYFETQWNVEMPEWAMNMRFFSADAPFDPDMPGQIPPVITDSVLWVANEEALWVDSNLMLWE